MISTNRTRYSILVTGTWSLPAYLRDFLRRQIRYAAKYVGNFFVSFAPDLHYITDPEAFFGDATYMLRTVTGQVYGSDDTRWRLFIAEDTGELLAKDAKGRPIKARTVVYKQDPHKGRSWVNTNPLRSVGGDEVVTFAYEGDRRKEKSREKVPEDR